MPRPVLYSDDHILDAVRGLVLDTGATAATVAAIARSSGAPIGSLYHRFGSRDDLVARMWIRAVRRSQRIWLAALDAAHALDAAVAAGLSIYDFSVVNRADAQLLVSFRRADLIRRHVSSELEAELAALNAPVTEGVDRLARSLFGSASHARVERVRLATFDIPYGAIRRHMIARTRLPQGLRRSTETAIRAVLASASTSS